MDEFIEAIRSSLIAIKNPRFYDTERGFQGELGSELRIRLPEYSQEGAVIEHEYQKRMLNHGIRSRPDLIIHAPFDSSMFDNRTEGNFVAIELKHRARRNGANSDYRNLSEMGRLLKYPLLVFINIDSDETFIDECEVPSNTSVIAFAVKLVDGEVEVVQHMSFVSTA